ncbi:MAG: CAAX protease, partial [Candidatus Eremiobacteraeota bacterium]|nr:CAAX protease [Candidatus Eremiobacteraeota bacterium]
GRTNLRQTLDYVESIINDRFVARTDLHPQASNYARYVAGAPGVLDGKPSSIDYCPAAEWAGRLVLPEREERFGGAFFEVQLAPKAHATLVGAVVRLCWSDDPDVRARIRAVTRDVNFSAEAQSAATYGGLVMPVRLNHWRLVDPLESLAGAHPVDDIVVKLNGTVTVRKHRDGSTNLFLERDPVQISGLYYGLFTFRGPVAGSEDAYRVVHFNRDARTFSGTEEVVRVPAVVPDCDGVPNSVIAGIEHSPLNADGWYAYGAFDAQGRFVVQSLAPRALLRADDGAEVLADARAAYRFARHDAWRTLVSRRGGIVKARSAQWNVGDVALVVHTYGGIGGEKREKAASGPIYFGHFAYGVAEVVNDAVSGEPRFDITYYQVYTQNGDGLTAGALHWSRYLGDRQFGWAGVRPTCDAILRLDAFDDALDAFVRQLEVMTARYRIGDGTGGTFVGAANNCSQDSNRALFATLEQLQQQPSTSTQNDAALNALAKDLRKQLQPFGAPRRDWSDNDYNLGSTMEDAPLRNLITALGSWRCILPRLAFNTIVGSFLRHGAALTILGTNQIGGERSDIAPVTPTAF